LIKTNALPLRLLQYFITIANNPDAHNAVWLLLQEQEQLAVDEGSATEDH